MRGITGFYGSVLLLTLAIGAVVGMVRPESGRQMLRRGLGSLVFFVASVFLMPQSDADLLLSGLRFLASLGLFILSIISLVIPGYTSRFGAHVAQIIVPILAAGVALCFLWNLSVGAAITMAVVSLALIFVRRSLRG